MRILKRYILCVSGMIAVLGGSPVSRAVKVNIESSGEGNFIWISHGLKEAEEVIFVDGGSSEYETIARRTARAPQKEKIFSLKTKAAEESGPTLNTAHRIDFQEDHGDSSSLASGESVPHPEEGTSAAETSATAGRKRRATQDAEGGAKQKTFKQKRGDVASASSSYKPSYRNDLLTRIYGQLPEKEDPETGLKIKQVKTILVTHADKDHYGWFRFLFEAALKKERSNFCIQDLVLSGFYEDYGEDFQA